MHTTKYIHLLVASFELYTYYYSCMTFSQSSQTKFILKLLFIKKILKFSAYNSNCFGLFKYKQVPRHTVAPDILTCAN